MKRARFSILLLVAIGGAACGSPPTPEIEAARASVNQAASAGANGVAAESMTAARTAQAALDAELAAQDDKWVKSYDRARELAVAAKAAGDKAVADATAGRERAAAEKGRVEKIAAARAADAKARVRIAGKMQPPVKVKNVDPVYPAIARSARVGGTVVLEIDIDRTGRVTDARVIKSVPLLDQAALAAVRQWEYTPMRQGGVSGVAVPVTLTVNINFTRP